MEKQWWLWTSELLLSLITGFIGGKIAVNLRIKSLIAKQTGLGKNVQQIASGEQKANTPNQTAISEHGTIKQVNQPFAPLINNVEQINYYGTIPEKESPSKATPKNPSVEFHKTVKQAEGLLRAGEFKESISMFEKASCMEPSEPISHFYLGFLYVTIGMPDASIIHSEKSIVLGKDSFAAWMNLGVAFIHNRQPERAVFAFNRAEQLKNQASGAELGKLYLFRAEARYNLSLQQNKPTELSDAAVDLDKGEEILKRHGESSVAKFWLEQVPNRRNAIKGTM